MRSLLIVDSSCKLGMTVLMRLNKRDLDVCASNSSNPEVWLIKLPVGYYDAPGEGFEERLKCLDWLLRNLAGKLNLTQAIIA